MDNNILMDKSLYIFILKKTALKIYLVIFKFNK